MIVPDVNVLVYAFHSASDAHHAHHSWLSGVVGGAEDLGLIDAVLTGVLRLVTHPKVFDPPADLATARAFVRDLRSAPNARRLPGNAAVWEVLDGLLGADPRAVGNLIPDAWIAAVTIAHGGRLATADRGMARWPELDWFAPVG